MQCVLYARVSTDKQAEKELSIPAQLQAMREHAQRQKWTLVEEFIEPGASAKTVERPALQRMLSKLADPASEIGVVLVHKIDRLARNVYDHAMIRALLTRRRIRLASVVENVDDSVSGQLVENIMASIAQFYSSNLGEEVKKGMRQKVLQGGWPHLPPIGYTVARSTDGKDSRIETDPERGPLVREAFELYATGRWGVRALTDHMASLGLRSKSGRALAQSYVRELLTNPFYAGHLRWKGQEYPGQQPVLVPPDLFRHVQVVLARRYRDPKSSVSTTAFPLKVVAVCASCRGSMTAERHDQWSYYRCCRRMANKANCSARMCNAAVAHANLENICRHLRLSSELAQAVEAAAERLLVEDAQAKQTRARRLVRQRAKLTQREQQLTQSFVKGAIGPETYERLGTELRLERERVASQLDAAEQRDDAALLAGVRQILEHACNVWDVFTILDASRQAALLRAVFEAVVLGPKGVVGYALREPFDLLFGGTGDEKQAGTPATPDQLANGILTFERQQSTEVLPPQY